MKEKKMMDCLNYAVKEIKLFILFFYSFVYFNLSCAQNFLKIRHPKYVVTLINIKKRYLEHIMNQETGESSTR